MKKKLKNNVLSRNKPKLPKRRKKELGRKNLMRLMQLRKRNELKPSKKVKGKKRQPMPRKNIKSNSESNKKQKQLPKRQDKINTLKFYKKHPLST